MYTPQMLNKLIRSTAVLLRVLDEYEIINTIELGELLGVCPQYIEKLITPLKQHGYVDARRGVHGGYWLIVPLAEIKLVDLEKAIYRRRIKHSYRTGNQLDRFLDQRSVKLTVADLFL